MNDICKRAVGKLLVYASIKNAAGEEVENRLMEQCEIQKVLDKILPTDGLVAEASAGTTTEISGHEYYGSGTWDRVPWKVSVFCNFKVPTKPDSASMVAGWLVAKELAEQSAAKALQDSVALNITHIREVLFKGLFTED